MKARATTTNGQRHGWMLSGLLLWGLGLAVALGCTLMLKTGVPLLGFFASFAGGWMFCRACWP